MRDLRQKRQKRTQFYLYDIQEQEALIYGGRNQTVVFSGVGGFIGKGHERSFLDDVNILHFALGCEY